MTATITQDNAPATPAEFTARALEHDQNRAQWLAELQVLEGQAGAVMLDEPDAAQALTERVATLRARADLEARAAAEARRRARATRVGELRAEVEALEPEVAKAQKALNEHDAKRDSLRKALEDFTGLPWFFEIPEPTGWRALRPREVLESAYNEAVTLRTRAQEQVDMVEADLDWMPPEARHQLDLRVEWKEAIERLRKTALELSSLREGYDPDDPEHTLTGEFIRDTERELRRFYTLTKNFRDQGLDLTAGEVSALRTEFGLTDGSKSS